MRARITICLIVLLTVCAGAAARGIPPASAADLFGVWSGTWEGAGGSGGFVLTLEKGKDGAPAGKVSVSGEPTYDATLATVSLDGKSLKATYDFPPDASIEILLTATFEGQTAKGTWTAKQKSGDEVASGTWTVSRK